MPHVKRSTQGNIVLVSSGVGLSPARYAPLYSAAKAAKAAIHSFAKKFTPSAKR